MNSLDVLVLPLALLAYCSGLLLWPVRRWLHRKQKFRGKWLFRLFIAQLVAFAVTMICSTFIRLEHYYYWFGILIELNIVFTIIGIPAWVRDNHFERTMAQKTSA